MLLVADNLQITRSGLTEAVLQRRPEPIQLMVQAMQAAGAQAIDLNTGPLGRSAAADTAFCVAAVQAVSDLPLLIDTADPAAMRAGLEANRKTVLINGLSLEPRKLQAILPLAVEFDVDVVLYLLDEHSRVPRLLDERLAIALELYQHCRSAGLAPRRLLFDPVVAPLIWEDGLQRNRDLLEIIRRLPDLLDTPARTIAGLSNLTSGRGPSAAKRQLEQAFVGMLAACGLSWLLLDIHRPETVRSARNCHLLLKEHLFTWENVAL